MLKKILDTNNKVAILGFGKEGQSSLRFLLDQGRSDITIFDSDEFKKDTFNEFQKNNHKLIGIFGGEYLNSIGDYDIIIKTPGISPFGEKLIQHKHKFTSQTQIFFEKYKGKVIGITGTKGKSTISTLLYMSLKDLSYQVKLVGNIGVPVLDELDLYSKDTYDYIIYELSSYMLQDFQPQLYIGIINNIYPCHLDWHYNSFNIYKEAKLNILKNTGIKIINAELTGNREVAEINGNILFFGNKGDMHVKNDGVYIEGKKVIGEQDMKLKGIHNYYNVSAVLQALDTILKNRGLLIDSFKKTIKNFNGLPHRLQSIGIYEGIEFIDDAIATTPESTVAAINALNGRLQTLFLGGQDSGFKFDELRRVIITSSIDSIIAFPDTSEKIFPEIRYRPYDVPFEMMIDGKNILFLKTRSMKIAVGFTFRNSLPGKIVLLSSAAPSFSLWKNYTSKAQEFIKEVQSF